MKRSSPLLDKRSTVILGSSCRLWQQPVDGGSAQRLLERNVWERNPAFSPDGRHLANVRSERGKRALHVLD
jgi:Tol biopolymer transport system component